MKYKFTFKFERSYKLPSWEAPNGMSREFPSRFIKKISEGESSLPNFISYKVRAGHMNPEMCPRIYMIKCNFYFFAFKCYIEKQKYIDSLIKPGIKVITDELWKPGAMIAEETTRFDSPTFTNVENDSRHLTLTSLNRMYEERKRKDREWLETLYGYLDQK